CPPARARRLLRAPAVTWVRAPLLPAPSAPSPPPARAPAAAAPSRGASPRRGGRGGFSARSHVEQDPGRALSCSGVTPRAVAQSLLSHPPLRPLACPFLPPGQSIRLRDVAFLRLVTSAPLSGSLPRAAPLSTRPAVARVLPLTSGRPGLAPQGPL
ncbi:PREDICTED: atherin-like, partial [Chinchilla lanigera]|uniref:atherin-like n=1 Tax=Chinchilla lanigera TaxID=34839 RepID=UPI0006967AFF